MAQASNNDNAATKKEGSDNVFFWVIGGLVVVFAALALWFFWPRADQNQEVAQPPAQEQRVAQAPRRQAPPEPRVAPASASKAAEGNEVYTAIDTKSGEETTPNLADKLIHISRNGFRFCDAADPDICPWQMIERDGHVTGHFDSLEDGVLNFTLADPTVAGQRLFHDKVGEVVNRSFFANGENFGRVRVENLGDNQYRVDFIFCNCDGTAEQERTLNITFGDDGLATEMREFRVYNGTRRFYRRFVP